MTYKVTESLPPAGTTLPFIHSSPILHAHHCRGPLFWFFSQNSHGSLHFLQSFSQSLPIPISLFNIFTFPATLLHSRSSSPFSRAYVHSIYHLITYYIVYFFGGCLLSARYPFPPEYKLPKRRGLVDL